MCLLWKCVYAKMQLIKCGNGGGIDTRILARTAYSDGNAQLRCATHCSKEAWCFLIQPPQQLRRGCSIN